MTQEESTSFQPFPDYSSHEEDNEVQPALHFIHQESDTTTNANTANVESRNPFVQEEDYTAQFQEVRPRWSPDETVNQCTNCNKEFNFLVRKHHCRSCGQIFCHGCSKRFILLPLSFGYADPERLCEPCFRRHSSIDFSKKYDTFGPSDAPAVVLLHGSVVNRTIFKYQTQALSSNYFVITPDLPAHGSRIDDRLTIETAVQSLYDIISEAVPNKKALILGHSLGGYVAMAFARKFPAMCSALVLIGCSNETFGGSTALSNAMIETMYTLVPDSSLWTIIPQLYSHIPRAVFDETILRSGCAHESWRYCGQATLEPKEGFWAECIQLFPGPVLIVNGEKETRKAEAKFVGASANVRLHIIKGASHYCLIEPQSRTELAEVVQQFAEEIGWKK